MYFKKWTVEYLWNLQIPFVEPQSSTEHSLIPSAVLGAKWGEEEGGGDDGREPEYKHYYSPRRLQSIGELGLNLLQTACLSLSFSTFKMRRLIRSSQITKYNGNSITLHTVWVSLEKKL